LGRVNDSRECNRVVLVSVAQFDPGVNLGRRPGADKDTKTLHHTLSKLGFKVDIHDDLSGDEIYQLFLKESRRPVKDCFLAVLSSHGDEGCVFGADGKPVQLCRLFSYFDNENMEKKAKVFLVQACRGAGLDDGVEVDSAGDSKHLSILLSSPLFLPSVLSSGYGAFMHPLGSLTRLMTRLSHRVAYSFQAKGRKYAGKKEMPCLVTRLTREVFPFAEPGKDSGAAGPSATSLLDTQHESTRNPSIS
uniref:Caspase family p20 domain-containing protein n=1 Tax=Sander lucioperca TaxID=283035 RepID=A0A8C9Z291_SANLU